MKNFIVIFSFICLFLSSSAVYADNFYNPNAGYDPLNPTSRQSQMQPYANQVQPTGPEYEIQPFSGLIQNPVGYDNLVNAFLESVPNVDYKVKVVIPVQAQYPQSPQYQPNQQYQQQANTYYQQNPRPVNNSNRNPQYNGYNQHQQQTNYQPQNTGTIDTLNTILNTYTLIKRGY